jgi:ParB/RepB/Spo0J family partition protein
MNKPADALVDVIVEQIPIGTIRLSLSHYQAQRRKHFSPEALLELAASIQQIGVQQPIVVRQVSRADNKKYEIVFGERRMLAADRAGLAHVPCLVRDLSDEQVLVAQLTENKQREDDNPLAEAEGYAELKKLGRDAQQIADMIGKSKSYVFARLKLIDLCVEARAALDEGKLDYSKALLVARFTSEKLQKTAVKALTQYGVMSYSSAFDTLRRQFMTNLAAAPFAHDDATFRRAVKRARGLDYDEFEELPACITCPNNSANDSELQRDLGDAHMCTDKPCFEAKVTAFWKRKSDAAEAAGRTVIRGEDARKLAPNTYQGFNADYLDLDCRVEDLEFPEPEPPEDAPETEVVSYKDRRAQWEPPTYRQLLGDTAPAGTLLDTGNGLREVLPLKDAKVLLKAKGVKIVVPEWMRARADSTDDGADTAATAAERARDEERTKIELEYRTRMLREIHAKCKGPLKQADLARLVYELENMGLNSAFEELYPEPIHADKLSENDLTRYIICFLIADDVDQWKAARQEKPSKLLEVAARLKIDTKKIRTEVARDLKPVSMPQQPDDDSSAGASPAAKTKADPKALAELGAKIENAVAMGNALKKASTPKKATATKKAPAKKKAAKK